MSGKPSKVVSLKTGVAIGAPSNKGFAATFNWLLSCLVHLICGRGVVITGIDEGLPRMEVLIEGGDGIGVSCDGDGEPYKIYRKNGGAGGGAGTITGNFEGSRPQPLSGAISIASAQDSNVLVFTNPDTGVITIGAYYT